jgi:oligopeptide transport system substrate-binding protein
LGIAGSLVEPAFAVTLNLAHSPETIHAYPTAFGMLDPIAAGDCFEGLIAEDAAGDAIPGQAASWTISPDGLVYTFALRTDIAWSHGEPVVAADFLAAFQWLFDPVNAVDYAYLQFPIRNAAAIAAGTLQMDDLGVAALDDRTLQITLERPTPYFLQTLTHSTAYPVPSARLAAFGRQWFEPENVVCNGPYTITEQGEGTTRAVRSETYYGRDEIAVDAVNYFAFPDVLPGLERFKSGEIDMFYDVPASANHWVEQNVGELSEIVPFLGLSYYAINLDRPPFDDPAIRRALSMAIDRTRLDPQGVNSPEVPAYGLVPKGTANASDLSPYRPAWANLPYARRVEEAAAAMAQLGYTRDNPLKLQIRYSTSSSDAHQTMARDVAAMWAQIGVAASLFSAEFTAHYDALRAGDFDVGRSTWILDFSDPSNILELMGSRSDLNVGLYTNPAFDDLLSEAAQELDLSRRANLLAEAERLAVDDVAVIPLTWVIVRNLIADDVAGVVSNAKNVHRTRWVSIP